MNLYVIFDRLAEEGGPVFESKNDATAVRQFQRVFENRPQAELASYRLLRVGTIDHTSSRITVEEIPYDVEIKGVVK